MAADHNFHALEIACLMRETADAVTLSFAIPDALRETYRFKPGQHITVRFVIEGEEHRRNYSITSRPGEPRLALTIKHIPGGLVSSHIHTTLRAGDAIDVMAPSGRFGVPAPTGAPRQHLAIAAGSGITPIIGMIEQVLAGEPESRFTLLYGNRSVDQIIFRERLEGLKNLHMSRLCMVHVLSRDQEADVPVLAGRLDGAKVTALVPATTGSAAATDHVYLCGPGSMIKDARDALLALGVPRERIHFEFFKAGPEPAMPRQRAQPAVSPAAAAGSEAVLIVDGVRKTVHVPPGGQIVDTAIKAGVAVPYSCKGGMCCTCRAKLIEGRVEMTRNFSLEQWEMDAGFVLACQSVPQTDRVVLSFDQM